MNTFFARDSLKHSPNVNSAVLIAFPLERVRRRAAPRTSEALANGKRQRNVVPLRHHQAAQTVDRLLHLRFLQEAVFALKLQGRIPSEGRSEEGRSGPL